MKKHFGQQLKAAREAKGYTQKALGDLIGLDGNSIARIERGEQGMRWPNLQSVVEMLSHPPSYYFSNEAPKGLENRPDKALRALLSILSALDHTQAEEVLAFAKALTTGASPGPPPGSPNPTKQSDDISEG